VTNWENFFMLDGRLECSLTGEDCDIIEKVAGSVYWWCGNWENDYDVMKVMTCLSGTSVSKLSAMPVALQLETSSRLTNNLYRG
jgi:hypothetical protein